jgi:hypothetical protein
MLSLSQSALVVLRVAVLSLLALTARSSAQVDIAAAITFLKSQHAASGAGAPHLVSYLDPQQRTGLPIGTGFLYDNAVGANTLLHHGLSGSGPQHVDSLQRAESILLTMSSWQLADGSFFEAYVGSTPVQFNRPAGPTAWFALSALQFVRSGAGSPGTRSTLLASALDALTWIEGLHASTPLAPLGGYLWGYLAGGNPCGTAVAPFDVMSIEHHACIHAAAMLAFVVTADPRWGDVAEVARQFMLAMWQGGSNAVAVGTGCGNLTLNTSQHGIDAYLLPPLSMQNDFLVVGDPQGETWSACLPQAVAQGLTTLTIAGTSFTGFDFCPFGAAAGIHTETTAQAALVWQALPYAGPPPTAALLATLRAAQKLAPGTTPGSAAGEGLVAAIVPSGNELPTCFGYSYFAVQGVAPTCWGYHATLGVGPHYLMPASPAVTVFGQDTLNLHVTPGTTPPASSTLSLHVSGKPGHALLLSAALLPTQPVALLVAPVCGVVAELPTSGSLLFLVGVGVTGSGTLTVPLHLPAASAGLDVSFQTFGVANGTIESRSEALVVSIQ